MSEVFKSILYDEIERCFKVIALATQHILSSLPENSISDIRKMIDQTSALLMEDVNLWNGYWFNNNMVNGGIKYPVKSLLLMAQRLRAFRCFYQLHWISYQRQSL